jgi:hypothetical protein
VLSGFVVCRPAGCLNSVGIKVHGMRYPGDEITFHILDTVVCKGDKSEFLQKELFIPCAELGIHKCHYLV